MRRRPSKRSPRRSKNRSTAGSRRGGEPGGRGSDDPAVEPSRRVEPRRSPAPAGSMPGECRPAEPVGVADASCGGGPTSCRHSSSSPSSSAWSRCSSIARIDDAPFDELSYDWGSTSGVDPDAGGRRPAVAAETGPPTSGSCSSASPSRRSSSRFCRHRRCVRYGTHRLRRRHVVRPVRLLQTACLVVACWTVRDRTVQARPVVAVGQGRVGGDLGRVRRVADRRDRATNGSTRRRLVDVGDRQGPHAARRVARVPRARTDRDHRRSVDAPVDTGRS